MEPSHVFRVFQAETGRAYDLNIQNTESVENLKELLAHASGIPIEQQILLNLTGVMLEPSQPLSIYENDHVFLFYRKTFTAEIDPEHKQPAKLEVPSRERIEIPESLCNGDSVAGQYAQEFFRQAKLAEAMAKSADSRQAACERAKSEHQVQLSAIEAATNNLQTHEGNIQQKLSSYLTKYHKAKAKHNELLTSFDNDIQQLKRIKLHNTILSESKTTLYDCIPEKQLRQWGNKLEKESQKLEIKTSELERFCQKLHREIQQSNLKRPTGDFPYFEDRLQRIQEFREAQYVLYMNIQQDFKRVEELLSRPNLAETSALRKLHEEHEQNLRIMSTRDDEMYTIIHQCYSWNFVLSKNLFAHLRSISSFQSHIRKIGRRIAMYSEVIKKHNENFRHLDLVHRLPETYVHCIQEVVRRRGYRRKFITETRRLAERLNKLREDEVLKREEFTRSHASLIPLNLIPGLEEKPPSYSFSPPSFDSSLPEIDSLQDIEQGTLKLLQQIVPSFEVDAEEADNDLLLQMEGFFYRESDKSLSDSESEADVDSLNEKLAQMRKQQEISQKKIEALEQEKQRLEETFNSTYSENKNLNSQVQDLQEQLSSCSGSFSEGNMAASDIEMLKRYPNISEELKKSKQRYQKLRQEFKRKNELYESAMEEVSKIASLDSELRRTKAQYETARNNEQRLETELLELKQNLNTSQEATQNLDSPSQSPESSQQSLQQELQRREELNEQVTELRERISTLEQNEKSLKELVTIKEQQRAETSQNCAHSEKRLKNLTHHLDTLGRNFDIVLDVLIKFTQDRQLTQVCDLLRQVKESKSTSVPIKISANDLEPLQDFIAQLTVLDKNEIPVCVQDLQKGKLVVCVYNSAEDIWEVVSKDNSQEYFVSKESASDLANLRSNGYALVEVTWIGSMAKSASSSGEMNLTEVGVSLRQW